MSSYAQLLGDLPFVRGLGRFTRGQRFGEKLQPIVIKAQPHVRVSHSSKQTSANLRIASRAGLNAACALFQEGLRRDRFAAGTIGRGGLEQLDQEVRDLAR